MSEAPDYFSFQAIGFVESERKYRFETPRQAVFAEQGSFIRFVPDARMAQAAADLRGFDRVWVLFCFHLNLGKPWKAKVRPPVSPDGARYGVFATRSPHRPNPIGLSCVELLSISDDGLGIGPNDLLDGTPVLDIKPYIPEADAFPDVAAGWRDMAVAAAWEIDFSAEALDIAGKILSLSGLDLIGFCKLQLGSNPFDRRRKRVRELGGNEYAIGCRTWQIRFEADLQNRKIQVREIQSNYTDDELSDHAPDPYADKDVHRAIRRLNRG